MVRILWHIDYESYHMTHMMWLNLHKWARLWPLVNHPHERGEGLLQCMFHLPYIFHFRKRSQHIQSNLKTCLNISSEMMLEWNLEIWLSSGIPMDHSLWIFKRMSHILWLIGFESYKGSSEIPNLILILIFTKFSAGDMVATCPWITWPDCFLNPFFWNQIHCKIPVVLFYF